MALIVCWVLFRLAIHRSFQVLAIAGVCVLMCCNVVLMNFHICLHFPWPFQTRTAGRHKKEERTSIESLPMMFDSFLLDFFNFLVLGCSAVRLANTKSYITHKQIPTQQKVKKKSKDDKEWLDINGQIHQQPTIEQLINIDNLINLAINVTYVAAFDSPFCFIHSHLQSQSLENHY